MGSAVKNKSPQLLPLAQASHFEHLKKFGRRYALGSWGSLSACMEPDSKTAPIGRAVRVGFVIPSRVSGAVDRNKLKRWSKAILRSQLKQLETAEKVTGLWICLAARRNPFEANKIYTFKSFSTDMEKALAQIFSTFVASRGLARPIVPAVKLRTDS